MGNVKITKIGFTKKLSIPRTNATINAVEKLVISIPFIK